jgi:hypothetical protein
MNVRIDSIWEVIRHQHGDWVGSKILITKVTEGSYDNGLGIEKYEFDVIIYHTPNNDLEQKQRFQKMYPSDFKGEYMGIKEITPMRTVKCFEE